MTVLAPKNIREVFEQICARVQFDKHLYKTVCLMQEGFVSKKRDHMEFFGGTLTGVHVVRFTSEDRNKLFDQVLGADEDQLKHEVYALKDMHGVPSINQDFKVSSDIFNIASIWVIHGFHHSKTLDDEQRHDAKTRVCEYMLYKFLTSLLFHYFKFPADPEVAAATYASLSNKYALKQQGSWGELLKNMASGLMGPDSNWASEIDKLDNDKDIVLMLNDMQSRVKDTLKNIYAEFIRVNNHGGRIHSSTSFHEVEGEFELKDNTKSLGLYTQYLKRIVTDKPSFIRDELVDVISNMMHTMNSRLLYQALAWTSDHYKGDHDSMINETIDLVMEHAIEYLGRGRPWQRTNLFDVLSALRGTYMSSRSTDTKLIKVRNDVEHLIEQATGSRNPNAVASVRTGWMLYIVARAYTMRHYANA